MSTSFLLSRRLLNEAARSHMPSWQDRLFIMLARNVSVDAANYFQLPTGRVIEVGIQARV
jgi:KUP system potassium uptake protein